MKLIGLKTPVLKPYFNLVQAIENAISTKKEQLQEGDIVVVSSKVVALSEGRLVKLADVVVSKKARGMKKSRYGSGREDLRVVELVIREADAVVPGSMLLTLKDGILIPEAGIDLSNVPHGWAILWPKSAMKSARELWNKMRQKWKIKKLGFVISDSHCQPLRWGTTGIAVGWAGFAGVEDARGQKDIYGKKLQVTRKAVADNLASAAGLVMGEGGEKTPFVLVHHAPVEFTSKKPRQKDFYVAPDQCIFEGIYRRKFIDALKSAGP